MPGKTLWFGVLVIFNLSYSADAQVREYMICPNDTFIYPEAKDSAYYQIDFGDGTKDSGYYPLKHLFANQGKFKMNVFRTLNSKTDEVQMIANVGALPKPSFEAEMNCYLAKFTNQIPDTIEPNGGWKWNFGDGTHSNDKLPRHLFQKEGGYVVNLAYARKNNCQANKSISVQIKSDFYPGFDVHVNNNDVLFLPLDTSEISYHWDFGDHTSTDSLSPVHEFDKAGIYPVSLVITSSSGCETFYSDTIKVTAAGIQPLFANANLFAAYPNPFKNDLLIHYEILGNKTVTLNIYDASGKLIVNMLRKNQRTGRYDVIINPAEYGMTRGIYFLNAFFDQEYFSQKLVME